MKVFFEIDRLPFCCGFMEAGAFSTEDQDDRYYDGECEDLDKVIPTCLKLAKGRPIVFNFVKLRTREMGWADSIESYIKEVPLKSRYECSPLRQKVRKHPGVRHLHTWINSNSGNQVDSYLIKE